MGVEQVGITIRELFDYIMANTQERKKGMEGFFFVLGINDYH